jgi:hypothetical protein
LLGAPVSPVEQKKSARSFVFPPRAANTASLQQYQGEGKSGIRATLAVTAAHRILHQQQTLNILHAKS